MVTVDIVKLVYVQYFCLHVWDIACIKSYDQVSPDLLMVWLYVDTGGTILYIKDVSTYFGVFKL